jgi:hypothetical protein
MAYWFSKGTRSLTHLKAIVTPVQYLNSLQGVREFVQRVVRIKVLEERWLPGLLLLLLKTTPHWWWTYGEHREASAKER